MSQEPPPPPSYGPPPPSYGPPPPENGLAVAALVLGIIGLAFGVIPILGAFVGFPCGVLAAVFGFIARRKNHRRTMATWGGVLGVLALCFVIGYCTVFAATLDDEESEDIKQERVLLYDSGMDKLEGTVNVPAGSHRLTLKADSDCKSVDIDLGSLLSDHYVRLWSSSGIDDDDALYNWPGGRISYSIEANCDAGARWRLVLE